MLSLQFSELFLKLLARLAISSTSRLTLAGVPIFLDIASMELDSCSSMFVTVADYPPNS